MLRIWKESVIMGTFLLTLVRHGETAENKLKIVQGHTDTKLVEIGVNQAILVGQRLENETFTHVFSSDLRRASETCEIISNHNRAKSASITLDSRLRERKLGVLEGQSQLNCYNTIKTSKKNLLPGMETKTEVRERAKSFFRELCRTISKSEPSNNRTSKTCNSQCPCCNSHDCKCCPLPSIPRASGSGGSSGIQDPLCNVGDKTSKHLKNGAPPALENLPSGACPSVESSSDEEHLGITPDVLQLGRQVHSRSERTSDNDGSALNASWGKYKEGWVEESRPMSPEGEGQQLANVLLVSHGGFLLELINYFFKELKCKRRHDPSKEAASSVGVPRHSIMSNAGLSQFVVSIDTKSAKPTTMTCLYLNDRKHLSGEGGEEEEVDSVAGRDLVC